MMPDHAQSPTDDQKRRAKPEAANWYAKLHPIGTAKQQTPKPKRLLNLSIFFRIWLAVALVLLLCGMVVFSQLFGYVKPTAHQVIEDTLSDTSQLLAASLQAPMQTKQLYKADYQRQLDAAFVGNALAKTSQTTNTPDHGVHQAKSADSRFRVYVTDSKGKVIYDSLPEPDNAEDEDYSRWNDVYLTLRGKYGARSTVQATNPSDSVMYVAQPIRDDAGRLIGVVSVGKSVASVLPYLENTRKRMLITALLISIAALTLAGLVAWWLKQSITLVTEYTGALAENTKKPYFYLGRELNSLTDTIETMKHRLENRAYVNDYVHTLTHELKSPLTAIRASSELLEDDGLDNEDRHMLSQTISEQALKMQQLIDRLLLLATVEQPTFKLNREPMPLLPLLNSLSIDNSAKLQQQQLPPIAIYINDVLLSPDAQQQYESATTVFADPFWLVQALQNILDNAIYFATTTVTIRLYTSASMVTLALFNDGKLLPDYAVDKAFNRYFSLSHQSNQQTMSQTTAQAPSKNSQRKKGTGLGLTLVKQVIEHHGGSVSIRNMAADTTLSREAGVQVTVSLPIAKTGPKTNKADSPTI